MKVENMRNSRGDTVPNQFIITERGGGALGNFVKRETFQSYESIIAVVTIWPDETRVELDEKCWNYSRTTSKYRNIFLGETTKETLQKIESGVYFLTNLN